MNMCKGALLSDVLYLIHIGERDSNDMEIAQALDILRSVRNELVSPPQPHTDTEQVGRMVQRDLPMDMPPLHDPVNHPSHYTSHTTVNQQVIPHGTKHSVTRWLRMSCSISDSKFKTQ